MFTGSIVALITPMDKKGAIDKISLKRLIDYHIISGTTAILSAGTTGEACSLSREEHINLVMWSLEFSNGRIPIIVGINASSTAHAVAMTNIFNESGVAGYLIASPYCNLPTQQGLFLHFKAIAENSNLPQILYNVPKRTGCDILPTTVSRLSEIKNIIGIKETTTDLNRIIQTRELVHEDFFLLSGNDSVALDLIKLGGKGVISVTANIAAKEMSRICALAINKQYHDAYHMNCRLMPIHQGMFFEPNPIPVKWACKALGLINTDTLRLPLTSLTKRGQLVVQQALVNSGLFNTVGGRNE